MNSNSSEIQNVGTSLRQNIEPTVVSYVGKSGQKSLCGYCKKRGSINYGMLCERLWPQDYQDLLDRGWRRSGDYLYRPCNKINCCPAYTITCDALQFKLSKSQRRCIDRVNRFIYHDERPRIGDSQKREETPKNDDNKGSRDKNENLVHDSNLGAIRMKKDNSAKNSCAKINNKYSDQHVSSHLNTHEDGMCISKGKFFSRSQEFYESARKNKHKRVYRRILKLMSTFDDCKVINANNSSVISKIHDENQKFDRAREIVWQRILARQMSLKQKQTRILEECLYLPKEPENAKHSLELKFHKSSLHLPECRSRHKDELNLLQQYQMEIHHESENSWTFRRYSEFLIYSPLIFQKIPWEKDDQEISSSKEKTDENRAIDECDLPREFGSYHCEYWLDKSRLIAVGVVDVLPQCLSSVYLYYHPEFSFLNLGIYSALREIEIVRRYARQINSKINQYYMGFYIPTCPKMAYKIQYKPSKLLCNETCKFVDSKVCLDAIKKSTATNKYCRFFDQGEQKSTSLSDPGSKSHESSSLDGIVNDDSSVEMDLEFQSNDNRIENLINFIQVQFSNDDELSLNSIMSLRQTLQQLPKELHEKFLLEFKKYIELVGTELALRMLLNLRYFPF